MKIDGMPIEGKRILCIVPHQDDEVNMCGGTICLLGRKNDIDVLYTTNGDYTFPAAVRCREAVKSLKHLGVPRENVFFLGYADQPYDKDDHLYMRTDGWLSEKNISQTYSPCSGGEWCFRENGVHHRYNKINFIADIKSFLAESLYDIIFCIDLDFHPDHIAASLSFEQALGEVVKEQDYHPVVFKGFAYENSFYGKKDFFRLNPVGMELQRKGSAWASNPYYHHPISFSVPPECYSKNLLRNPIFCAMAAHKSQIFCNYAESVINSNNVFFERRTDNIAMYAKVSATSGKAGYVNDFLLCDADNIMHGDTEGIRYNAGIWMPDSHDGKKEIVFQWEKERNIESIVFYHGRQNSGRIKEICIYDGRHQKRYTLMGEYVSTIKVHMRTSKIAIRVIDKCVSNGFSEIEIFEGRPDRVSTVKGIINGAWTDKYYVTEETELDLGIYSYGSARDFDVSVAGKGAVLKGQKICICSRRADATVRIQDRESGLVDEIRIKAINRRPRYLFARLTLKIFCYYQRVIRKVEWYQRSLFKAKL